MSEFVEVKVSKLTGAALDWAVADAIKAWEFAHELFPTMTLDPTFVGMKDVAISGFAWLEPRNPFRQDPQIFNPSGSWVHAGQLLEKYCTALCLGGNGAWWSHAGDRLGEGDSALVAMCRAIAATKFGEVAIIPAGLIND